MDILRIIIYTLAGGAVGFLLGATASGLAAAILHMSKVEGGIGVFAAGIGLLSGMLAMVVTLLAMLHSRGVTGAGLFRGASDRGRRRSARGHRALVVWAVTGMLYEEIWLCATTI